MRWGRALLILVIGLVAFIVVALLLAPSLLNLEQIKEQVVQRVEQQLHRDVELGQVRLEWFSGLGAGLDKLIIANPQGWQSPYFVKVDTLSVKVALLPLLSRKIEVSKITLHTGEIVIERNAQGRFNYDDLTATSTHAPDTAKPVKPPPSAASDASKIPTGQSPLAGLLVEKLALDDVDIKFIDQMVVAGESVSTAVRQVHLEADNIGFNTPIEFSLSSAMLVDSEDNVWISGRVGPIPDHGHINWQQIPLELTLKATALSLAPVVPYLGDQAVLTAGELGAEITVQGTLGDTLDLKGQLSLQKAVMPATTGQAEPVVLPAVTLTQDLTLHFASALLTITKAQADIGTLQATLAGSVKPFYDASPQFDLSLNTSTFAIADVIKQWPILAAALPETMAIQGNIVLQATVKGTPERLQIASQLGAQPLSVRFIDATSAIALSQVQFDQDAILDMPRALITLQKAKLDLGFLQATGQGTIANFDSTPQLDLNVKTSNFDSAKVFSHLPMLADTLPQPADVQGDLQLQATLQGTPGNLNSDARVTVQTWSLKSGTFHGGEATVGGMRMDLSQMQTNLQAQFHDSAPPTVNIDINAKRFAFDQHAASAAAAVPPTGKTPPSDPPSSGVPPLNVRGKIALAEGNITGIEFKNLNAVFSIINGLVKSQQTVQMFDGAYQGTLTANVAQAKPDYQVAMKLANIQAGDVANTFTSTPNILFGRLHSDLNLHGKGLDWNDINTTLTGTGKLNLTNFKLTTLDIMPKLAKGLSAVSTIAGFTVPDDLATRSFDQLKATLRVQDGKIRSDDLTLWGPDVQLLGKGFVGLDRSLAFDGNAVLLGPLAQSLGKRANFLMDNEGHINIPLAIEGTVTQPRIALNEKHLSDLAQRALTQQMQQKAGKEAKKLLDQVIPGAGDKDKPGDRPDPLKELNKTFKGLFNR
jgi:uncharacterized protein involved in outer membrane biogenesis